MRPITSLATLLMLISSRATSVLGMTAAGNVTAQNVTALADTLNATAVRLNETAAEMAALENAAQAVPKEMRFSRETKASQKMAAARGKKPKATKAPVPNAGEGINLSNGQAIILKAPEKEITWNVASGTAITFFPNGGMRIYLPGTVTDFVTKGSGPLKMKFQEMRQDFPNPVNWDVKGADARDMWCLAITNRDGDDLIHIPVIKMSKINRDLTPQEIAGLQGYKSTDVEFAKTASVPGAVVSAAVKNALRGG